MMASFAERLAERPANIAKAKEEEGAKVVGYFCPYVPVELVHAAGLVPLRLMFGGEGEAAEAGEEFLGSNSCPYTRACLGYRALGKNPYYASVDALCVAWTFRRHERGSRITGSITSMSRYSRSESLVPMTGSGCDPTPWTISKRSLSS